MYEILDFLIRGKLTYNMAPPTGNFVEWLENLDRGNHGKDPVLFYTHLPKNFIPEHVLNTVCKKFNNTTLNI